MHEVSNLTLAVYNSRMLKHYPLILVFAFGLLFAQTPSFSDTAKSPAYMLRQQSIAPGKVRLSLFLAHAAKPLWTQTVADPKEITWSANGRALALCFQPYPAQDPPQNISMLVWREGHPMTVFRSPDFNVLYGLWDFQWSPDTTMVAFRGGYGGSYLNNGGQLYVYDPAKNRLFTGLEDEVRRYRWVDMKTLQYWPLADGAFGKPGQPSPQTAPPKLWHFQG